MEIMSTKQAADYLEVSKFTILRLIKRGSIKAARFGNYWAIERESVEEYRRRNESKAQFDPTRQ